MVHYDDNVSRRCFLKGTLSVGLASFAAALCADSVFSVTTPEVKLPDGLSVERWDFEAKGIDGRPLLLTCGGSASPFRQA